MEHDSINSRKIWRVKGHDGSGLRDSNKSEMKSLTKHFNSAVVHVRVLIIVLAKCTQSVISHVDDTGGPQGSRTFDLKLTPSKGSFKSTTIALQLTLSLT